LHLEPPLPSNGEQTRGRWRLEAPTFGRLTWLVGRSKVAAADLPFGPGGCLVGPKASAHVHAKFPRILDAMWVPESSYLRLIGRGGVASD